MTDVFGTYFRQMDELVDVRVLSVIFDSQFGIVQMEEIICFSIYMAMVRDNSMVKLLIYDPEAYAAIRITTGLSTVTILSNNSNLDRTEAFNQIRNFHTERHFALLDTPHAIAGSGIMEDIFRVALAVSQSLLVNLQDVSDPSRIFHDLLSATDNEELQAPGTTFEVEIRVVKPIPRAVTNTQPQIVIGYNDQLFSDLVLCKETEFPRAVFNMMRKKDDKTFFEPKINESCFYSCLLEFCKQNFLKVDLEWLKIIQNNVSYKTIEQTANTLNINIVLIRYVKINGKQLFWTDPISQTTKNFPPNTVKGYFHKAANYNLTSNTKMYLLISQHSKVNTGILHVRLFLRNTQISNLYCAVCEKWVPFTHITMCVRCGCGHVALKNGRHFINCRDSQKKIDNGHFKISETVYDISSCEKYQYFADIETATIDGKFHVPYCVCVRNIDDKKGKVNVFYGKDCMVQFLKYLATTAGGYIWFHNGSRFDFLFVVRALLQHQEQLGYFTEKKHLELLQKGTRVIGFTLNFGRKKMIFRDSYMFLTSSLARLCKDFGVPEELSKSDFDHTKVFDWNSAMKHNVEASKYCMLDVLALEEIYKRFQTVMWEICPIPICKSMSLPGHGLEIWKNLLGKERLEKIHISTPEEYKICRNAYAGGRVMLTRPMFVSKNVDDYLVMVDVVSLYPTVMKKYKFPVGKPTITQLNEDWVEIYKSTPKDRSIWCVDIVCPKDILVAFLMCKQNADEPAKQTLEDKNGVWITGVELVEAELLGYKVIKAYSVLQWPDTEFVFGEYIDVMFALKQKHSHNKNSAGYQSGKGGMNAVSGKFGQKVVTQRTTVALNLSDNKLFSETTIDVEPLLALNKDKIQGYFITNADNKEPTLPTYLSVFILSHARVYMSEIVRLMDGYKNPRTTLYYTDTDSLIVHCSAIPPIQHLLGKEIGCLENEFPNQKIIEAVFLAPKTYALTIQTAEGVLLNKIRCKGIPHRGDVFPASEHQISFTTEKELDDFFQKQVELRTKMYIITEEVNGQKQTKTCDNLSTEVFKTVLFKNCGVDVVFGSLKKDLVVEGQKARFSITPQWLLRGLCVNDWWQKYGCPRVIDTTLEELVADDVPDEIKILKYVTLSKPRGYEHPLLIDDSVFNN